jgi:glycosyltransferase involved in cell wall biosynthesis
MDYWANVDAVSWFAGQVMPLVLARQPKARFYIVGSRPAREVLALKSAAIEVTGHVEDTRPYIYYARANVAPLRIARGIQNKVLEGMAMAKAVVTTSKGSEGLNARPNEEILVADEPGRFADLVCELLAGEKDDSTGASARRLVLAEYGWEAAIARFVAVLEGQQIISQTTGESRIG